MEKLDDLSHMDLSLILALLHREQRRIQTEGDNEKAQRIARIAEHVKRVRDGEREA